MATWSTLEPVGVLNAPNSRWLAFLTDVTVTSDYPSGLPYDFKVDNRHYCHGSPLNLEEFDYIFAPEQARECLSIWDTLGRLTLIGHSHLCKVFALAGGGVRELPPQTFSLEEGTKYIVSVGSVGQPRDYDNRASFVVFDSDERTFEFKRVEYDIEAAATKIFASNLERNFGHRLFIGV